MPLGHSIDQPLGPPILLEPLLDFRVCGPGSLKIAFIHNDDVGQIEHHNLLQLQSAAVVRIHHQDGLIDYSIFLERHRFLTCADSFDDHIIKARLGEKSRLVGGRTGAPWLDRQSYSRETFA